MNQKIHQLVTRKRFAVGALALAAIVAIGMPHEARANSTADATILNVATVTFDDASGDNTFTATASSTITVNLVEAALNKYLPPAKDTGVPGAFGCDPQGSYASGDTVSTLYALVSAANGDDTYTLTDTDGTDTNVSNVTRVMEVLDYTGSNGVAIAGAPGTGVVFGSAIAVAVDTVSPTDTLIFPGGSLAGFAADDIVLVDVAGTMTAFLVDTVTVGSAASHTNLGDVAHNDAGATTAEVQGSLKLKAYPNQSKVLNGKTFEFGGAVPPAFDTAVPVLTTPVGEMKLIHVSVQASVSGNAVNGTSGYTLATTDGANTLDIGECEAGEWIGTQLTITKKVKNITKGDVAYVAGATGDPEDVLEYQLTLANAGGTAKAVSVTDNVPDYTTLVADAYGALAFAVITDNAATPNVVNVTTAAGGEIQPLGDEETGFGEAAGTIAGSAIKFFLGNTAGAAAGGVLPYCSDEAFTTSAACAGNGDWITSYTIIYQVKID